MNKPRTARAVIRRAAPAHAMGTSVCGALLPFKGREITASTLPRRASACCPFISPPLFSTSGLLRATEKAFETTGSFVSEVRPRHSQRLAQAPEGHTTPQASQKARNALPPASSAPPPVNGVLPAAYCIFWGLNTISLRSKPAAKALLLSPAQPGGIVSIKQIKQKRGGRFPGRPCVYYNASCFKAGGSSAFTSSYCNTNLQPSSAGTNIPPA